jgi:hypothetical protein
MPAPGILLITKGEGALLSATVRCGVNKVCSFSSSEKHSVKLEL